MSVKPNVKLEDCEKLKHELSSIIGDDKVSNILNIFHSDDKIPIDKYVHIINLMFNDNETDYEFKFKMMMFVHGIKLSDDEFNKCLPLIKTFINKLKGKKHAFDSA